MRVNGIVSHIRDKPSARAKSGSWVVDGMAFWQYGVLRTALEDLHISLPKKIDFTRDTAQITCLSRQANLAGKHPTIDYTHLLTMSDWHGSLYWQTGFPAVFLLTTG